MSDHDRSHPTWEIPPPLESGATRAGADVRARRPRQERRRLTTRFARGLVAATVGLGLLLGGGAAGVAVAAAAGPDQGVTVPGVDDHRGPGVDGIRAGRAN